MGHKHEIHWFGPVSMLGALWAGLTFALGHHFFYNSLDGQEVPSGSYKVSGYDSNISKQQSYFTLGTAFAFAVKTCLVLAVSTAYIQLFWKSLAGQLSRKPFTLRSIDKAYSALGNATLLANMPGWRRFPLLFTLALTTWLIPIASIIAPATLSIESQPMFPVPVRDRSVPVISFESLVYAARMDRYGVLGTEMMQVFRYEGPSQALKRIARAVSAQGDVLPINPPSGNATWSSNFSGPALRCDPIPLSEHDTIYRNILAYTSETTQNCLLAGGYLTWHSALPYIRRGTPPKMDETPRSKEVENAMFRVAVLPGLASYLDVSHRSCSLASLPPNLLDDSTLLECRMVNTTYHVDFEYTDGNQTVIVDAPRAPSDTVVETLVHMYGPRETNDSCAELQAFRTRGQSSTKDFEPCVIESESLKRVAYQSILDAFFGVIGGPVSRLEFGYRGNILSTALLDTLELGFLTDYARAHFRGDGTEPNLHVAMGETGRPDLAGLGEPDASTRKLSLAEGLEQVFLNLTVSLMSSPLFQPNATTYASLPKTPVASATYHNVYSYTRRRLWITYGVALLCATVGVALGLHAIVAGGASYSNEFSTILRVSRHAHLDHEIAQCDAAGRDPLPKYLAKATLTLTEDRGDMEEYQRSSDIRETGDNGYNNQHKRPAVTVGGRPVA